MKRWVETERVELDPRSFEQRLWDEFSLALIIPRFIPSFIDDETIDAYLHHVHET
jgi:hypothetical protein